MLDVEPVRRWTFRNVSCAMNATNEAEIWAASAPWLEAAGFLGIGLRVSPPPKDVSAAVYHLMVMCRTQFAAELSYKRFTAACESQDNKESSETRLDEIARGYLELHSFFTSAHLYWRTLEGLSKLLSVPELKEAIQDYAKATRGTKCARDHLEHMTERIEKGRSHEFGFRMDACTFRRAMGKYEVGSVAFGDETLDLGTIHGAVVSVGRKIAPRLRNRFSSGFEFKMTASGTKREENEK